MSRRAHRKVDYSEPKDSSEEPVISPAKRARVQKVVKVEETISKRKSSGGREVVKTKVATKRETKKEDDEVIENAPKINRVESKATVQGTNQPKEDPEDEELSEVELDEEKEIGPPKRKINSVKSKFAPEVKNKKAPAKRKAKKEDEDEGEDTKVKKKRKTKEEKEEEAMPLAARTAVASLKKTMHIGAHVSGAGGKSSPCGSLLSLTGL